MFDQHDIDRDSTTEEETKRFLRTQKRTNGGGGATSDPEADVVIGNNRMARFFADFRTWGCLACMAVVVIVAVVIIILAATGVISANGGS